MDIVEFRERVRLGLADSGALTWSDAALDEAARQALFDFNLACPRKISGQVTLAEAGQTASLDALPGFVDLYALRLPEGFQPRGWVQFWDGDEPLVRFCAALPAGQVLEVHYSVPHTIAGLDEAAETSVPDSLIALLARGACGFAARQRALALSEQVEGKFPAAETLAAWSNAALQSYTLGLQFAAPRTFLASVWEEEDRWNR